MAPINDGDTMKMHTLGSLQTISYSTHQDRAPVRSIGNINAKDYVQGQRTIAGTMVFAMFHQHWMIPFLEELEDHVSNTDIWSDELPALNLTLSMVNEYGYRSCMVIYGVKFIDDGGVMSINDLYTENTLQYVATGIQPLKSAGQYQHSCNTKVSPFKISESSTTERSWSWSGIQSYNKKWPVKYRDVIVNSEEMTSAKYRYIPTVYTNKPIVETDDYILDIEFKQPSTVDHNNITNVYAFTASKDDAYEAVKKVNNIWTVSVPKGEYHIGIKDVNDNFVDDVYYLRLGNDNLDNTNDDYPIIVEVGESSVKVLPNNIKHDHIMLTRLKEGEYVDENTGDSMSYEIVSNTSIGQSNSKEVLIENLQPDTKYSLYTYKIDSDSKSHEVSFKTFNEPKYGNELLKEYVINNSDILVNKDLATYNFNNAKYEYDNIIDSLMDLPNSNIKTELLFYAVKLQNELNACYNESGNLNTISLNKVHPLLNKFEMDDDVASIVVYKRKNNKNYYTIKVPAYTDYEYNGAPNTHYFAQPILKDNKKGVKNDFVCFDEEQRKYLKKYEDINTLSQFSFINYESSYENYNDSLKNAIKAANNLTMFKALLPAPYAEVKNEILYIDIDYSDHMIEEYYLCIATPFDALNCTPIRKIKINNNSPLMKIEKYRTGIIKNNYYLLWIQDKNFNNISPAFILSTYKDDIDIIDYNYNKCSKLIKSIKSNIKNSVYMSQINDAMLNILADEEELKYKDLEYYLIQLLLVLYGDQKTPYVMDDIVINIVDSISKNPILKSKAKNNNGVITFSSDTSSTFISCINITNDYIEKSVYKKSYNIDDYDNGYSILCLTDGTNSYRSGYILVNNSTKEVYASNIELETIKDGC